MNGSNTRGVDDIAWGICVGPGHDRTVLGQLHRMTVAALILGLVSGALGILNIVLAVRRLRARRRSDV